MEDRNNMVRLAEEFICILQPRTQCDRAGGGDYMEFCDRLIRASA